MYLVSACLCNFHCRYDKTGSLIPCVEKLLREGLAVPVCPEILGGLTVPRPPAEIQGKDGSDVLAGTSAVINILGEDVTKQYIQGAWRALIIALQAGCQKAILKARSPSCGLGKIYDGTFSKKLKKGDGVLASLLKIYGFTIYTEKTLPEMF